MFVSAGYQVTVRWGKWKSWPVSKGVPWPWHWPIGKSPLCRSKAINQLLYPANGSDQMRCVVTWQRSLSLEANTRSTQEISVPNQSWGVCHHPASNWSYQSHEVPYLVPRTSHYLPSLWTDIDHWPHALGMCSSAGNSGWIIHCWLSEDPLWEDSRDLHSGIFTRSRILQSDMNCPRLWTVNDPTCVGRLICSVGRVSSLNKSNPIQYIHGDVCLEPVSFRNALYQCTNGTPEITDLHLGWCKATTNNLPFPHFHGVICRN